MSRYKVQYLPGGIQRDLGLAVRMRRDGSTATRGGVSKGLPVIDAFKWFDPSSGDWDVNALGLSGSNTRDPLAARLLGDLAGNVAEFTIVLRVNDYGWNTYTWTAGAWDSSLPSLPVVIPFDEGIVLGGNTSMLYGYLASTITLTADIAGETWTASFAWTL
jgi:hypothetical protein